MTTDTKKITFDTNGTPCIDGKPMEYDEGFSNKTSHFYYDRESNIAFVFENSNNAEIRMTIQPLRTDKYVQSSELLLDSELVRTLDGFATRANAKITIRGGNRNNEANGHNLILGHDLLRDMVTKGVFVTDDNNYGVLMGGNSSVSVRAGKNLLLITDCDGQSSPYIGRVLDMAYATAQLISEHVNNPFMSIQAPTPAQVAQEIRASLVRSYGRYFQSSAAPVLKV